MVKKTKAVFFDLDGSTLESDLSLSDSFMTVVNRYRDRKWIITTGRGMWSVCDLRIHESFDVKAPHIFDNGAHICHLDGESVQKHLLSSREKQDALAYVSSFRCVDRVYASVLPRTGFVWPRLESNSVQYGSLVGFDHFGQFADEIMVGEVTKLSVKCSRNLSFHSNLNLNVVRQEVSYDILSAGTSKGSAINTVRELLGLEPEEIAFICDDKNDLSAINSAALRGMCIVKVGTKLPYIRADVCVESVHEVAWQMEHILAR